jgi:hypothetical protein
MKTVTFLIIDFRRVLNIFIQPLKMDLTEGSETSAKLNLAPGKYPKENIQKTVTAVHKSRHLCIIQVGFNFSSFVILLNLKAA